MAQRRSFDKNYLKQEFEKLDTNKAVTNTLPYHILPNLR